MYLRFMTKTSRIKWDLLPLLLSILASMAIVLAHALAGNAYAGQRLPFTPPQERPLPKRDLPWPENSFVVLAYHDVNDDVADQRYLAVTTKKLVAEFAWLKENGYQPISVTQILRAHEGLETLPPKAILLSFDDGFSSFYTRVFPILKANGWPAMLAPVGAWVGAPTGQDVDFGGLATLRSQFATWQQIKELHDSGLVEIASHTQNMHFGQLANPQGNSMPAAASLRYDPGSNTYETPEAFTLRVDSDIQQITANIEKATGQKPRAWVWPYGAAHGVTWSLARQHGYRMAFILGTGLAHASQLDSIPRLLVSMDLPLDSFAEFMSNVQEPPVKRVAHVDLDYVYDPDPEQQERNIGLLVQRIQDMRVNTVFLQAFADPDGDGNVRSVYFPNSVLPMRADLFNRVAWQIRSRGSAEVYAWMPVLSWELDPTLSRVEGWDAGLGASSPSPVHYRRLSPFDERARAQIKQIYRDLAWHATFSGILFHDDAKLTEQEDSSAAAMRAYRAAGFKGNFGDWQRDPAERERWVRFKTQALTDFTLELIDEVRKIDGVEIRSARNIYANVVLDPESERWFAQNLENALDAYDWTVPMTMPLMEKIAPADINAWLDRIVHRVAEIPGALDKTIFEVQAVDWDTGDARHRPIPTGTVMAWVRRLQIAGARHIGYYPDNFVENHPDVHEVRKHLSHYWFPAP